MLRTIRIFNLSLFLVIIFLVGVGLKHHEPAGKSLFNGKDFTGWKVPTGDNGHWKIIDGVIDYDAESEAPGEKSLWTEKEYQEQIHFLREHPGNILITDRPENPRDINFTPAASSGAAPATRATLAGAPHAEDP